MQNWHFSWNISRFLLRGIVGAAKGVWEWCHFGVIVVSVVSVLVTISDPLKTDNFGNNPYLILIVFDENAIFNVFDCFWLFLSDFGDTSSLWCFIEKFSPKPLSNPRGWRKKWKPLKITEKHENDRNSSKCHRQIWYSEKWSFSLFFMFFSDFRAKGVRKRLGLWTPGDTAPPIDTKNLEFRDFQWISVIFRDFQWISGISLVGLGFHWSDWDFTGRTGLQWGLQWGFSAVVSRDPYHGGVPVHGTTPYHPLPRVPVHHHWHHHAVPTALVDAKDGFTRLLSVTVRDPKYPFVSKTATPKNHENHENDQNDENDQNHENYRFISPESPLSLGESGEKYKMY